MKLSTFIESLLRFIHWAKIFQFFLSVFTRNRPTQKFNCDVTLSAWVVPMEICPKGISISIWHLPIQLKVQKQHITRKPDTSEAIQNPFKHYDEAFREMFTAFSY